MHLKIRLWKEIYHALRQEFDCGLFVFGSTFNGFGLEESDMDMCLLVQETGGTIIQLEGDFFLSIKW
jgi:DNA polymerase sigma